MNTGSTADLLKCTYTYGKAWKSTFQRFLLALIGTLERHRPALFACAPIAQIAKLTRELERSEQSKGGRPPHQ